MSTPVEATTVIPASAGMTGAVRSPQTRESSSRARPGISSPAGQATLTGVGSLVSTSSTSGRRRFRVADHPEWLMLAVAAAAWIALALMLGWLTGSGGVIGGHHHGAAGPSHTHSFDGQLLSWTVMVVAMMLPTTVPHLRYLAFNTRRSRRQRSIALFVLGYLAVWLVPGLALAVVPSPAPAALIAIAVLTAGAWELTPAKRRALRRCCRTHPVGYAGASADASAVEYGLRHGVNCLLVSGVAMAALMLAGHPWWATVALAVAMAAQKLLSRPERWRAMIAIGWLASGLAVAGAAVLPAA